MSKIVIIGGGASGLFLGCNVKKDDEVIIIEKNDRPGRKLAITGKGRCNITNMTDMSEFIKNVPGNGKFLYSAFYSLTNNDVVNFFESHGVKTKVERGERVFPVSDSAKDVVEALYRCALKNGVKFRFNTAVNNVLTSKGKVTGVRIKGGEIISADKVVIATGGLSYPKTGSTGDGYKMARELGHTVIMPKPSLVGLITDTEYVGGMQGLSLKNIGFKLQNDSGKVIYEDFGEMLFTHFGISGPVVLSGSRVVHKYMDEKLNISGVTASIDLKPALSYEKLDLRVQRDFSKYINKQLKNALFDLLPEKMINAVIKASKLDENKAVNSVTREERLRLIETLKNFTVKVTGIRPIDEAIVTSGGIKISEIDPKTMESKIVEGLYFCGEVIDVDAFTGGFNLQIAFSTAYLVSEAI